MKAATGKQISVIIPARNEAASIRRTLSAVLESARFFQARGPQGSYQAPLAESAVEVLVIDNQSSDATPWIVHDYSCAHGVKWIQCERLGAPCARNCGSQHAASNIYVFLDADTRIPLEGLQRVYDLVNNLKYEGGIFALQGDQNTWSSWCWWNFWNAVRRLPLARAKALPAFMFCTREVFDQFGPFDETVQIGEEWPILAELYRRRPERFVYDRSIAAITSDRRMTRQRYGYAKVLFKYVWAVLHRSGRNGYPDTFRD